MGVGTAHVLLETDPGVVVLALMGSVSCNPVFHEAALRGRPAGGVSEDSTGEVFELGLKEGRDASGHSGWHRKGPLV